MIVNKFKFILYDGQQHGSTMLDRQDLPPKGFLMQITDLLTKIYMFLWDKKDENNIVMMNWSDLSMIYSKNAFRSCVRKIHAAGLLNCHESKDRITIELIGWDEISDD